jgi:hypothetical protein
MYKIFVYLRMHAKTPAFAAAANKNLSGHSKSKDFGHGHGYSNDSSSPFHPSSSSSSSSSHSNQYSSAATADKDINHSQIHFEQQLLITNKSAYKTTAVGSGVCIPACTHKTASSTHSVFISLACLVSY